VLFNGGNYLEWICPWWFLDVMQEYRDRDHKQGQDANWGHLFEDIATLEARHALTHQSDVSLALFALYFGDARRQQLETFLWSKNDKTGILGHDASTQDEIQRLNDWICNLAKVGFHLHRQPILSNAV
jgi:CRISPR-associated protein Cmr2